MSDSEDDRVAADSKALVRSVAAGDLVTLKRALLQLTNNRSAQMSVQLSIPHSSADLTGPLLHHAIQFDHNHIVSYLFEEAVRTSGSIEGAALSEPTFFAFGMQRYSMVLLLLAKGCDPNQRRSTDGNTLLHLACQQRNPPFSFITQLMRLKRVEPNIANDLGWVPLHYVAVKIPGLPGREVAKLLRAKGAKLDLKTPDGKTAAMMTKNAYLREVLTLGSCGRRRELPVLSDDEMSGFANLTREAQDKVLTTPRELREPSILERRSKGPKLSVEDQESVADRLYRASMDRTAKKMQELKAKYETPLLKESRVLTEQEMEEAAARLYYEPMEFLDTRREELMEKYVPDPGESTQLTEEEMQESVSRLYGAVADRKRATQERLEAQYVAPLVVTKKRLVGQKDAAAYEDRMYYDPVNKSGERSVELYARYGIKVDNPLKVTRPVSRGGTIS